MTTVTVIMGGQYGSEGKGKIAAYIAPQMALSIRTGGPNAGHTFEHEGVTYKMQTIPCAFVNPNCLLAIGAGGVIDLEILRREIALVSDVKERLMIDPQASIITEADVQSETILKKSIASTGKGVGAAIAKKVLRKDVTLARDVEELEPYLRDVSLFANQLADRGAEICLEGTQGFWLSLHHGEYPYVTGRDITVGTLCGDAGISPSLIKDTILVVRTYPIRVGGNSGPLSNEISWEEITKRSGCPREILEFTTVTKKVRRVGEFDIGAVKRAVMVNRPTQIALMFVDYLNYDNFGVTEEGALTEEATLMITQLEVELGVPITLVGTGPSQNHIIDRR